jgi:DNA-binding SARP family transcriptional activator
MGVKPRQILELISLGRGEPVRKTAIAEQIWAGRPPRRWQVTLESYVALLRRAMQPGVPGRATVLCTTPGGYRVDIDRVDIDLHDFDRHVRRAAHAAPEDALPLWERAMEIADGALLATEPYAAWAVDARRTHERGGRRGRCGGGLTLRGRAGGPARLLRHRARPARRARLALLIRAELAAGRRAEAAHAFHRCRASLRDLGLEPTCAPGSCWPACSPGMTSPRVERFSHRA